MRSALFSTLILLGCVALAAGDAYVQYSGPFVNPNSAGDPTTLSGDGILAVLSALLNVNKPDAAVSAAASQQVACCRHGEMLLRY